MMYLNRNRYLAGNICFFLFLAFLFSLAFTAVPNAAQAVEATQGDKPQAPPGGGVIEVKTDQTDDLGALRPTTRTDFATVIKALVDHLNQNNDDLVTNVVYQVYERVYGTVYEVYQHVLWLVYGPPPSGYNVGTNVYSISYLGLKDGEMQSVTVDVPVPVPRRTSDGGGGATTPPSAPSTTQTDFGTVVVDSASGACSATVNPEQGASLIEAAREQGQATVDFRAEVPAGVTISQFEGAVPAATILTAIENNITPMVGTAELWVALDPAAIPAEVRRVLTADPNATVSFNFTVLPAAEGRQVTAGLPDTYVVAGSVVTVSLQVNGRTIPGALTLAYETGSTAGSGLFAALDFFGLFRDGSRLAAAGVDEDKLGVYRYNEASKTWEYVGGRIDKVEKTVTAKVADMGRARYAVMAYDKTFADLVNHWARRDVEIMAARHIAGGVSADRFNPSGRITRAEFAAMLIRTLGIKEVKPATAHFKDVAPQAWYYGAIETAYANGLMNGYGDGTVRPKANISRQEMASMIHRALTYAGKKPSVSQVDAVLARFGDAAQIGAWARESMAVAVSENILRGYTAGTVAPKANATRAEATVMLKRSLVSLGELSE